MVAGLLGSLLQRRCVMKMTKSSMTTAGIDTAKSKLDIAIHKQSRRWQVKNDLSGWQALAETLTKAGVDRVGIEATGAYERGVVDPSAQGGLHRSGASTSTGEGPMPASGYGAPKATQSTQLSSPPAPQISTNRLSDRTTG